MHAIDFTRILCRIFRQQCNKRMLLVGGFSSDRPNALLTMHQTSPLHLTFSPPGTMQGKDVILFIRAIQIQAGRHNFRQINRLFCCIFEDHTAGDHICFFKCSIDQFCRQSGRLILQVQDQGVAILLSRKSRRQPGKRGLLLYDLMRDII